MWASAPVLYLSLAGLECSCAERGLARCRARHRKLPDSRACESKKTNAFILGRHQSSTSHGRTPPSHITQVLDCFCVYAIATAAVQVRPRGEKRTAVVRFLCALSNAAASPPLNLDLSSPSSHHLPPGAQVLYMLTVGSFPFNSFLSGLFCSVGFFVLTGEFLGWRGVCGGGMRQH